MERETTEILHNHLQLCQWEDDLEFLCFMLCEIAIPLGPKIRYAAQAMDLSDYIKTIDRACDSPGSRLNELLPETEKHTLKSCLQQTKRIRNTVAHRIPTHDGAMRKKEATVQSAISILDSVIKRAAEKYRVSQVDWYPIVHTPSVIPAAKNICKVGIVLTESPILRIRQTYLHNGVFNQAYSSKKQEEWLRRERERLKGAALQHPQSRSKKAKKHQILKKSAVPKETDQQTEQTNLGLKGDGGKKGQSVHEMECVCGHAVGKFTLSREFCFLILSCLGLANLLVLLVGPKIC